jgi:hypothetical protein
VVYKHNGVFFSHKEKWNYVICRKWNETGDHYAEWDTPKSERRILHFFTDMQNTDLKIIIAIMIIWHDCKRGTVWGKPIGEGRGKGEDDGG